MSRLDGFASLKGGRKVRPSVLRSSLSSSYAGDGTAAVSMVLVSLEKMELAPAIKQRAWSLADIFARPADRRTMVFGMTIRAVAIMRTVSHTETSSFFSKGVPATFDSTFTGKLSGCGSIDASVCSMLTRSATLSPRPRIPPEQSVTLVFLTLASVFRRSAKVRVVIESRDADAVWGTVGVSENVIEASWLALVDSFEYKLFKDEEKPA